MQLALLDPGLHGFQAVIHQAMVVCQDAEPQAMRAQAARHHGANVELLALAGGRSVDDDAPELTAAAKTLSGVFAAEHFKNRIHSFAVGEFADARLVIDFAIVDTVIESQLL